MTSVPQPQLLTADRQGPPVARAAVWLLVLVLLGCGGGRAEPRATPRRIGPHLPDVYALVESPACV